MRTLLLMLVGVLAAPLSGQQVYFAHPFGDSAAVILTGDTGSVQIRVYTGCAGLSAYTIRVYFDSDRLTVTDADSVPGYGFLKPTRTSGTDYVELSATGSNASCTVLVADVRFALAAAAVEGSLLSLRAIQLTSSSATDLLPNHYTLLGQVCQAERVWGDPDGSRTITSRDALIILTAAVGLPTDGFDLSASDVDGDFYVTTRDALFVLSRAIGLYGNRAGVARINRCAPLAPAPADAAFYYAGDLWRIAAGDTMPVRVAASMYPERPTWKPDGSRILFTQFVTGLYNDYVSVTPDGLTADTLGVSEFQYEYEAAWAPSDALIAFVSARVSPQSLFVMAPDGSNQTRLTFDSLYVFHLAWTPDDGEIVFTAFSSAACCTYRLFTIAPNGTGLREITTLGGLQPQNVAVSPVGDSVVFETSGQLYTVDLAGVGAPQRVSRVSSTSQWPQWVPAGRVFRSTTSFPYGFYLERIDGRILRWARGISSSYVYLRLRTP
ncbi:MAG: hypothetical protein WD934_05120 [Gemmatimonadales bacterium]